MGKNCRLCFEHFCCIFPRSGYTLLSISGRDTSPVAPPRGISSTYGSSSSLASNSGATTRSEFYVPTTTTEPIPLQSQLHKQQQQQQQSPHSHHKRHHHNVVKSAKPSSASSTSVFNNTLIDFQNHNSSINFNEIHEQFRQLVMKDILVYQSQRELITQPLIQL